MIPPAIDLESLRTEPNALAGHYSRFRVSERLLLTGHSHQAWPDCGFEGQRRAWEDAARLVDGKWEEAFARAERVRAGYARLLGAPGRPDEAGCALGASTHELLVRLLSALPLAARPRLVTTDGEFHSIRRQLDRLAEEGIEVARVPAHPAASLAERMAAQVDERTAAALVSAVLYRDARIVSGLGELAARCESVGAELLVDAYHALGAMPFDLARLGLDGAFVVGGGYKYCQLGEGNAFLRVPPGCELRPVVTGWFAEFAELESPERGGGEPSRVRYGRGAERFAGSTYDPTSHYRAAEVFAFVKRHGLAPEVLREVSQHQVRRLAGRFDALDLDPALIARDRSVSLSAIGGFLALETPRAAELSAALADRGVATDYRGDLLRLGPAPYLCDRQLDDAVEALADAAASLRPPPARGAAPAPGAGPTPRRQAGRCPE